MRFTVELEIALSSFRSLLCAAPRSFAPLSLHARYCHAKSRERVFELATPERHLR
jgi:hypothetical protein